MEDDYINYSKPIDASDYNKWIDSYIGDANVCQIEFKNLTQENILELCK